jgi:urea carboxylase-associated protein 2
MPEEQREIVLIEETLPGAAMASYVLPRHHSLRFTDEAGGANVSLLLFNRELLNERYNMADTLKAQHTAFVTRGHVLYSDMGRVLCSLTHDSCGWHDTFTGLSDAQSVARYGQRSYETHRNEQVRNARDELLIELGKWGLGTRDLVPNVNLFTKVAPDSEGKLRFASGHSPAGSYVELRAEMNVLVVLSTCPHVLDPEPQWQPKPVRVRLARVAAPGPDDACRQFCPENGRGFANTERMFLTSVVERSA